MTEHESKAHILATALAVFAEKGFAKASMNDIVRASGLSKGGVYWHFKSKNALIQAIFDQFFVGQLVMLDAVVASDATAVAKLTQLATFTSEEVKALASQFPSSLEFYALAAREEGLKEVLKSHLDGYRLKISALIEQGIADGDFRQVNSVAVANTIIALFEGFLLVWGVSPEAIDLSADVETAVQLLLDGLRKPQTLSN